jgi:tetratricopeptide (TPR) repeat protein
VSSLDKARTLFESALDLQQRGDLRRAELAYREALELAPERPSVLTNLLAICLELGKHAEAITYCERLVALDPGDPSAHLVLANCHMLLRSPAAALISCDRALAIKPDFAEALLCRGSALLELGRRPDAMASYDKALKIAQPGAPPGEFQVWRISREPRACFEVVPQADGDRPGISLEPMTVDWSGEIRAWVAKSRIPAPVSRLKNGRVLGLSFLPANEDGETCLDYFAINPQNPDKVRGFEEARTMPVTGPCSLMTCLDGVDQYAEGVLIGNHRNFGHWMLSHLARLALVESVRELQDIPLIVGENISASQLECLGLMGYESTALIRLRKSRLGQFGTLWVPAMPHCVIGDGTMVWAPAIVDFLRKRLGVGNRPAAGRKRRRLYITRQGTRWRRVLNERAIVELLDRCGFEVVDPGALTIGQQLDLAADAEVVVGAFGAGMNLLLFAPPDAALIELKPIPRIPMNINPSLCRAIGQSYRDVIGTPSIVAGISPLDHDFTVSADGLLDALRAVGVGDRR